MVLKLYGSAMSTSRVLVTLLEKELPYELILIDITKGEQKSEQYKKLQPFGKMPYPSGKKLIPEGDDKAYARFEEACSIEQSYFAAAAETIGTELIIKPMKDLGLPDEARVSQAKSDLDTVLAFYDKILSKQKYIAGDELTLADLFALWGGFEGR
ncbi:Glutathione S-transferase hmp2 [Ciborinia camelliae]|nr:Glutathione S-transferase hmp2 [Ciborinia camelliae]